MRTILKNKRRIVGLSLAIAVTAAVAVAFWTSGGSTTGTASTGDATNFTVAALDTPSGLVPNSVAQDLRVKVTNPASHDQQFSSIDISIDSITEAQGAGGECDPTWFTVTDPTVSSPVTLQESNAGTTDESTKTGSIALNESGTNQDACKGATVNLDYEVN